MLLHCVILFSINSINSIREVFEVRDSVTEAHLLFFSEGMEYVTLEMKIKKLISVTC